MKCHINKSQLQHPTVAVITLVGIAKALTQPTAPLALWAFF